MHIQIKIMNEDLRGFYEAERKNFYCDSGFDLHCGEDFVCAGQTGQMLSLGVAVAAYEHHPSSPEWTEDSVPFMLIPRSSMAKTPIRLANSIGVIDRSYRGELKAVVDSAGSAWVVEDYTIENGDRLFQIVAFDGSPITYNIVDELDVTARGEGGHGSTGR